jgi:hypothetical protein
MRSRIAAAAGLALMLTAVARAQVADPHPLALTVAYVGHREGSGMSFDLFHGLLISPAEISFTSD